MEYGLIGEKLGHSFSKEIHSALADYEYELLELDKCELESFMRSGSFKAINVTIPYKEAVIPYLYSIDEAASAIGAVNTVVNESGKLYGYNTDFYGMCALIRHAGIDVKRKKLAILGSGGTSKTARAVAEHLGAQEIVRVSRTASDGAVNYEELYKNHLDTQIIINTTPVGMFPKLHSAPPADISRFPELVGVIDAVYNPLRTELVLSARERGIPSEGGLYMLAAQGVRASEIFTGRKYDEDECERVYDGMVREKENIVLIGMPASGKSTVGRILSSECGLPFLDTDSIITERIGMSISEYFSRFGEGAFRDIESEVIRELSGKTSCVIATGGGAVLRDENVTNLKKNGRLFFIDRPPEKLVPTSDRPLSQDRAAIEKRYKERYSIYMKAADARIPAECSAETVAERIRKSR